MPTNNNYTTGNILDYLYHQILLQTDWHGLIKTSKYKYSSAN